ncbi:hypothetical protein RND71_007684 [Anisodus tanguticus]|uniref:Uncharacterized protein n=1 Tax=Anisodus tanguticus TaxID=243964 RepID=A0AAE1SLT7_9SOLA|nr:hypothetical protein RND71_007684 [Anisodus tanguticus]
MMSFHRSGGFVHRCVSAVAESCSPWRWDEVSSDTAPERVWSAVRLPFLEQALAKVNTSDPDVTSAIIRHFSNIPKLKAESSYHKDAEPYSSTRIEILSSSNKKCDDTRLYNHLLRPPMFNDFNTRVSHVGGFVSSHQVVSCSVSLSESTYLLSSVD